MKSNIIVLIAILVLAINSSCEKEDISIKYPMYGDYGLNLLQIDSLEITSSGSGGANNIWYSLRAELPSAAFLKIIMRKKSTEPGGWTVSPSSNIGWSLNHFNYSNISLQIYGYGQAICEIKMYFFYSGSADIEIYENKAVTPSRIKSITW